jgi:hypothetical protein
MKALLLEFYSTRTKSWILDSSYNVVDDKVHISIFESIENIKRNNFDYKITIVDDSEKDFTNKLMESYLF